MANKKTTIETFMRSGFAGSMREKTSTVVFRLALPYTGSAARINELDLACN